VCLGGQLAQSETLPDLLIRWRLARSTTPTPSVVAPARPQGYALPTECQYVNGGSVDGGATTWKISCPEGLPSNYLQPSLAAQGWVTCGTKVWRKNGRQLAVIDAVNTSGFNGWLDQRPLSGANCTQATPPPNIGGSPP